MDNTLFTGQLVRLTAEDPEVFAQALGRWDRDSEYFRLLDTDAAAPWSARKRKEWVEKDLEKSPEESREYLFCIRTLEGNRLIGFIGLFGILSNNGDAWVGIGIGERDVWGKGFGTDAMRVILRYAFTELNLHRVTLDVFEYNPRAIRSYEKCGFRVEGRMRSSLHREGRRWDLIYMGILRSEWEQHDGQ